MTVANFFLVQLGAKTSIGVFILRRGADLDKVLRSSASTITSINNETSLMV